MKRMSFAIRVLFALCLLGATFNHLRADIEHGLMWDYGLGNRAVFASRIYWSALTVLHPLAAVLLFAKPRAGIGLTALIIFSDVIHNTYYVAISGEWMKSFYLSQVGFLVLVFALSPIAWRGLQSKTTIREANVRG
jgi:hypothetical protein